MLNLPGHAAVMYFHVWTPRRLGFAFYESPENVSCTASHCDCQLRRACCGAKRAVPSHEGGLHAMSDQVIEMVPEYYGLPSMSMRNAMYHMVAGLYGPRGLALALRHQPCQLPGPQVLHLPFHIKLLQYLLFLVFMLAPFGICALSMLIRR